MATLVDKIALVTGASRGIGKGIAIGLGEAGATVYITGRSLNSSNPGEGISGTLMETKLEVEKAGGKCIPVQVDHSNDEEIKLLFERIKEEQNGKLDILVNNVYSGVKALRDAYQKPFWTCDANLWDAINNVGLRSHYITSIFAAKMMTEAKKGVIFTISSWGSMSYIFSAAYGAGKTAKDRLAADMAVELKPYNVASISIWPGIVGTENITRFAAEVDEGENNGMFASRYNWETPLFTGRAIAALAMDSKIMNYTGKLKIVAEIADKYNLVDKDGNRPASLRSLRFILPMILPFLQKNPWLVPNIKCPWFLLLWFALKSPQI